MALARACLLLHGPEAAPSSFHRLLLLFRGFYPPTRFTVCWSPVALTTAAVCVCVCGQRRADSSGIFPPPSPIQVLKYCLSQRSFKTRPMSLISEHFKRFFIHYLHRKSSTCIVILENVVEELIILKFIDGYP